MDDVIGLIVDDVMTFHNLLVKKTVMLCCYICLPRVPIYMQNIQIGHAVVAEIMYAKW